MSDTADLADCLARAYDGSRDYDHRADFHAVTTRDGSQYIVVASPSGGSVMWVMYRGVLYQVNVTRQYQRLPDTECEVCHDTYIDLPAHQQAQHANDQRPDAGWHPIQDMIDADEGVPVRQPDDQQTDVDSGEDT